MRREFIEADSREEAKELCPWASTVIEVDGGWMCFESVADAETWEAQV